MSESLSIQGASFAQNGTIDWVELVKSMINDSVGILRRVSAAGVDTYTVIVAQALGQQFQLTRSGRQRVTQAVDEIAGVRTIQHKLWLGFGANNFVRIITRTEEGTMCLAMCSALSECYYDQVAAEIIMEMVRTSNAPGELQPSVFEWRALLHATAGIYARTTFSTLAEDLISRHRTQRGLPHENSSDFGGTQRCCSSPESIARALLLIGRISRGKLDMLTISGNSDAGWIAAFAVWHFDLAVRIVWEDNVILYESEKCIPNGGNAQLLIMYTSGIGPQLVVSEKTHRLQDATALIMEEAHHTSNYDGSAIVAGRLPWTSLLSKGFGPEFKKIQNSSYTVGIILGSLSRIVQGIVMSEDGIDPSFRTRCRVHSIESYGRGLVESLLGLFPELECARTAMEEAVTFDLTDAFLKFETSIEALKIVCACKTCQGKENSVGKGYCVTLLLEVLFIGARTLANVRLPANLFPSRIGLEMVYTEQLLLRWDIKTNTERQKRLKDIGPSYFSIDGQGEDFSVLFNAIKFMSTRPLPDTFDRNKTNAVSSNGICFCSRGLTQPSCGIGSMGEVDIVLNILGRIDIEEKSYAAIFDSAERSEYFRSRGRPDFLDHSYFSLRVKEKASSLQVCFEFKYSEDSSLYSRLVRPATLVDLAIRSRGMVKCNRVNCRQASQAVVLDEQRGYKLYQFGGKEIETFQASWHEQMMLLESKQYARDDICMYIDQECMDCALHAMVVATQDERSNGKLVIIQAMEKDFRME